MSSSKEEKELDKELLESFKPGEYAQLMLLVKLKDMNMFLEHVEKIGMKVKLSEEMQAKADFFDSRKNNGDSH